MEQRPWRPAAHGAAERELSHLGNGTSGSTNGQSWTRLILTSPQRPATGTHAPMPPKAQEQCRRPPPVRNDSVDPSAKRNTLVLMSYSSRNHALGDAEMAVLLINFVLHKPDENYPELFKLIKSFESWVQISDSSYAVATHLSPDFVGSKIRPLVEVDDRFYVLTLHLPYYEYGQNNVKHWLETHLS
jgi:hypothetical protein